MSIEVITVFLCTFNLFGFYLVLSDAEEIRSSMKKYSWKQRLLLFLSAIVVTQIIKRLGIYMVLVFVMEYVLLLFLNRKKEKEIWESVLKGIICLTIMTLTQIGIVAVYSYKGIEDYDKVVQMDHNLQIFSCLAMAMVQLFLMVFLSLKQMKKGFLKTLLVMVGVSTVEDMVCFYLCIVAVCETWYVIMVSLFLVAVLIKYAMFRVLMLKVVEQSEQIRRADVHTNTYEYYLHMEEEHLQIRKMYHEMKNWMMILNEGGNVSKVTRENQKTIAENLEEINCFYHTGQPSLNMLLYDARMRAQAKGIEFDALVSEGCLSFMAEEDVNILFGNAIINAIEACEKITDGPKKIQIRAGVTANDTLVCFKNTVSKNRRKGSLITEKKNKIQHGIGISSIQECVEKYNGYLSIKEENATFQLAILFYKE